MNTSIRGWERGPRFARVIFGETLGGKTHVDNSLLFAPGEVVAYLVGGPDRKRLLVFRTLEGAEAVSTLVAGVQQRVRILVVAYTGRRIIRGRQLLRCIVQKGSSPSALSDAFYLRAASTLSSRVPIESIVTTLLRQEHDYDALRA